MTKPCPYGHWMLATNHLDVKKPAPQLWIVWCEGVGSWMTTTTTNRRRWGRREGLAVDAKLLNECNEKLITKRASERDENEKHVLIDGCRRWLDSYLTPPRGTPRANV